ncbi:MAG TPA: hypothetical protein VHO24_00585 [Opitutaceae bacterium]|nr:hypothetical protein [Opitutaceae bacterium]
MKPTSLLLTVSIAANVALLVAYTKFYQPAKTTVTPATASSGGNETGAGGASVAANAGGSDHVGANISPAAPPSARSWAQIETDDLDELARRLKAAGFSGPEVRSIMSTRISEKFQLGPRRVSYWQSEYRDYSDPKVQEAQAEMQALLRKHVYGPDHLAEDPEQVEFARRQYGPLPLEKLRILATIDMDLTEQMRRPRGVAEDPGTAQAAYLKFQQEKEARIKAALTPEEYAVYELRSGPVASQLRFRLAAFQPSEEEYKTLFVIQKSFQERMSDPKLTGEARQALENEMMNHVTSAFGAERALDYQEAARGGTDQTARLVSTLGLPARVAGQVRSFQKDFTERAQTVRTNGRLPAGERAAQLAALAQEARSKLNATLGAEGFEAYNDMKGEWIRALEPK